MWYGRIVNCMPNSVYLHEKTKKKKRIRKGKKVSLRDKHLWLVKVVRTAKKDKSVVMGLVKNTRNG